MTSVVELRLGYSSFLGNSAGRVINSPAKSLKLRMISRAEFLINHSRLLVLKRTGQRKARFNAVVLVGSSPSIHICSVCLAILTNVSPLTKSSSEHLIRSKLQSAGNTFGSREFPCG